MAVVVAYTLWKYVPFLLELPYIYLLTSSYAFAATFVLSSLTILYRNVDVDRGYLRALITKHNHAVWMTIFPVRPWKITAGQYVNVWNPLVDLFSSLHSHPFTIAASRDGEPEVLIQPRSGFIRRLLDRADDYQEDDKSGVELHDEVVKRPFGFARKYLSKPESSDFRTAFVSGFHNSNTSAGEDGRVIMIASGNP